MAGMITAALIGNIGRDAELRRVGRNETPVLEFTVAVSDRNKKGADGRPGTEWYRVKVWGKQAETLEPYLLKGKQVYVDGTLSIQEWKDRDGKDRHTPEVNADRVVLLGSARGDESRGESRGARRDEEPAEAVPSAGEDDIPF